MFSWGFYILVNIALLLGATPLLDIYRLKSSVRSVRSVITITAPEEF